MEPTTAAAGAVAVNSAIQQVTPLLKELIERVKDGKTATLVSQIQTHQQTILTAYFEAKQKALDLATENFELKQTQAAAIEKLNAGNSKKVRELEQDIATLKAAQCKPVSDLASQFSDKEVAVLKILASAEDGASDQELERLLNLPKTVISFCLQNLDNAGYAESSVYTPNRGSIWRLTSSGNAYAVRNDFVGPHPPSLPRRRQGFMRG